MTQTEDSIRENERLKDMISHYIETLVDCAENYMQNEDHPDQVVQNQYQDTLKNILITRNQIIGHIEALKLSQRNPESIRDERAFKQEYQQSVVNNTETITNDHPKLKELRRRMWAAKHTEPFPEDDNEIIVQTTNTFICPLTKRRFVEPYKSKVCGHIFSKDAIFNLIGHVKQMKCPFAGCDKMVTKDDFQLDYETVHAMEREANTKMSEDDSDDGEIV
ncbi:hypothetical protein EIN_083790 [Entamoeba invadens IP1]|uniref:hypothetical protein n=1 Tax=Entamoeba invadens IP1 TaxID=370355 RepID=UPI0002C3DB74|nr:hypothetical protein EIN_083790 [Entamoeba invadens IP1]ELP85237.1 hypothetical protein EIN_083790 [Entamoeba invadens IP1]|eukprot:XP_004184583.1 hypothetical protein EIN_083790 [Entamoeba invadens IP1]